VEAHASTVCDLGLVAEPCAMRNAKVVRFDTRAFPFRELVGHGVFHVEDLAALHREVLSRKLRRNAGAVAMKDNIQYRRLLERLPDTAPFYLAYHAFVRRAISPHFDGKISYSGHPTFRVHMPGTARISGWHRDVDVTGRLDQINVWVPFVDTSGTNTLWIETHYGREDYVPVALRYGEALLFDGGLLLHGSVPNESDVTRVSMDFRFAPLQPGIEEEPRGILSLRPR